MSLFSNKLELEIIEDLIKIIEGLLQDRKRGCTRPRRRRNRPLLVLTNQNNILMNTILTLGNPATSSLILVDNVTLQPVAATFTGQTVSSDTPSVATFAFDIANPTQVDATPLTVGTGNILLTATATYTDSNTGLVVTRLFSASYTFSVVATPEGLTLSLTDFIPATTSTTTTSTTTV